MMISEMMSPKNKASFSGLDIEYLNDDLNNIEQATETCNMISQTLKLLGETRRWETIEKPLPFSDGVNEVFRDYRVLIGLASALALVVQTLEEADRSITVSFEKNTEFYEDPRRNPEDKG